MFMPGIWFLWFFFVIVFKKEKGNTFTTFLIIFVVESLQKEQNSTDLILWPQICWNKSAITPKWFNSLDTSSNLMANIWEKDISILAGNLNLGRTYLITAVGAWSTTSTTLATMLKKATCSRPVFCLLFFELRIAAVAGASIFLLWFSVFFLQRCSA